MKADGVLVFCGHSETFHIMGHIKVASIRTAWSLKRGHITEIELSEWTTSLFIIIVEPLGKVYVNFNIFLVYI